MKNAVVVGASDTLPINFDPSTDFGNVKTTGFSSYGPTDDGRIKPDIIAHGRLVHSTSIPDRCNQKLPNGTACPAATVFTEIEKKKYIEKNGTSMATPVVTGTAALLNELSISSRGGKVYSDEMKAVLTLSLIHISEPTRPY